MSVEQPIIVGLDIGTTKIAAIAGRKNEYGKLEILGFGRANSNGVKHGQVLNIDETIKAIRMALDNCYSSNPNLSITEVYVGIACFLFNDPQTTEIYTLSLHDALRLLGHQDHHGIGGHQLWP